ncbi:MAG TPA: methionine--tRNA ligase [Actinomycetes bacterium]|nr:methionine--tRNA ligase [Actinomycetes bacterium]
MAEPITYLTTTIPYVNASPHVGHALELVQADVLARHYRRRGHRVRFQTGTDDNSLKNVLAARAEGVSTADLVDRNAATFAALREPLALSFDEFVRTSRDPRHRPGVERLWRQCAQSGDLYRKHYEGRYCVGCEQFYTEAELVAGRCPEHGTEPHLVAEENWFFRLSRYQDQLYELISTGRLRIEPAARRNEVLAFVAAGLEDFSISRSRARAHGWGIPVPDDPDQVIYVWWDALGNYLTTLDYATDGEPYRQWWVAGDHRVHLLGKDVTRFHAIYWPAMLLSAGQPLPTDIYVHGFLTVAGERISKSGGNSVDPVSLVQRYGVDAVRWWLLREVPRVGDADFTEERLAARADTDLANGLGNLVNRTVSMVHRYRDGVVPAGPSATSSGAAAEAPARTLAEVPALVDAALADFDFRTASGTVWAVVEAANRFVNDRQPWRLAGAEAAGDRAAEAELDAVLSTLVTTCRSVAAELAPFLPVAADRIAAQLTAGTDGTGRLPAATPLFRRSADR